MEESIDCSIDISDELSIHKHDFIKMKIIFNAIENGWKIKKKQGKYVFSKKHGNKSEILNDNYLPTFFKENIIIK